MRGLDVPKPSTEPTALAADFTGVTPRRFVLAGGNGLIGRRLASGWVADGAEVVVLSRSKRVEPVAGARTVEWDGRSLGAWCDELEGAAAVVNLAGENLASGRWTEARKRRLRASRIEPSRILAEAIGRCELRPRDFFQISAVGFFGDRGSERLDEDAAPGDGFLADLCREWEGASRGLESLGVRRLVLRLGVVLARGGGALPRMLPAFRLGIAGRLGDGEQYFSWIHLDDVETAIRWLVERRELAGVLHLVAPQPVTNAELTHALAKALHRPAVVPVPRFALRLLFGEMAQVLLASQRVVPARLEEAGFRFRFPALGGALADLVASPR